MIIELVVNMPLYSKARPRVTARGTFMPKEYRVKQAEMVRQLKEQWDGPPLEGPLRLEIDLRGEGRGDADNILGSLMDAGAGILWTDDRISIIPEVSVTWEKASKSESQWLIRIIPLSSR